MSDVLGSSVGGQRVLGISGRGVFVLGTILGGALLGTLMMLLAVLLERVPQSGWLVVGGLFWLFVAASFGRPVVVGWRRQVSHEDIVRHSPSFTLVRWGVQLGVGFVTNPGTTLWAAYVAAALVTLPPNGAFGAGVLYGAARGLAIRAVASAEVRHVDSMLVQSLRSTWVFANLFVVIQLAILSLLAVGVIT